MAKFVERFSLAGRRALVTGASRGIGFEICAVLADAGADITAVARDPVGLAEVKRAVERAGRECLTIKADMATVDGPRDAARRALEEVGAIDILVNSAGISVPASLLETQVEDWDRMMAVNLRIRGTFQQPCRRFKSRARYGTYLTPPICISPRPTA